MAKKGTQKKAEGKGAGATGTDLQDLPGVDTPPGGMEQPAEENPPAEEPVKVPAEEFIEITVKIPIDPLAIDRAGYISRRADVKLTPRQSQAVRRVTDALEKLEEETSTGQKIMRRDQRAILWILDRLADAQEVALKG